MGRAQTQIDFLIGMTVFLLAIGFVFSFLPTMTGPFEDTSGSDRQAAERSASHLAEYALGTASPDDAPQQSAVLDADCVTAFFEGAENDDCRYESADLRTELGLDDPPNVQVSVDEQRRGGDNPTGNVAVSTRIVSVGGERHELVVKVW